MQFTPEQLDGFEVNRCYRGKVQTAKDAETYEALELTHKVFNEKVAEVCRQIFRVLNDKNNPEFAKLTKWAIQSITPAGQCSTHFANPFTLEISRANPTHNAYTKKEEMRELFYLCKERGDRWYDRNEVFGELIQGRGGGSGMVAEVNQAAIEKISSYLALMVNWREGKSTPLGLLSEDLFVKKVSNFIKNYHGLLTETWQKQIDNPNLEKDTELYEILLHEKKKAKDNLLKDIFRSRLEYGWLLAELDGLYESYNNESLGKKNWLKQKQHFDSIHSPFKQEYNRLLSEYQTVFKNQKETTIPKTLPPRWFRGPNFLRLLSEKGTAIWPDFFSPLSDADFKADWAKEREDKELPEQPWDSRKGRDLYVAALKKLNPELFKLSTGWFKIFEQYIKLQRFSRPPQFRYPDPVKHPEWINLSEGGCFKYRNQKVIGNARLEITVNLIDPKNPTSWKSYPLEIALDRRLNTLKGRQAIQVPDGRWVKTLDSQRVFNWKTDDEGNSLYKTEHYYPWVDPDGVIQWIQIHGGNLINRKDSFYLHFRYTYKTPKKPKLRDEKSGEFNYQPGTRLLGVDQGQKDDMVITIMELTEEGQLQQVPFKPFVFKKHKQKARKDGRLPGKVYYQWVKLPGGTSFKAIAHAEKVRSQRRGSVKRKESAYDKKMEEVIKAYCSEKLIDSEAVNNLKQLPDGTFQRIKLQWDKKKIVITGHEIVTLSTEQAKNYERSTRKKTKGRFLTRGLVFDKNLKNYIEHCRELHYKTTAGVLFKLAKENNCQGIVIENLNSYKVTLKQERFENNRLMTWAMQKKTDFLETLCDSGQMNFIQKSAAYTSQTCNHCESFGMRFNFPTTKGKKHPWELGNWPEWESYKKNGKIPKDADKPYPVIASGGDWFVCSNESCSGKKNQKARYYTIQADANAAKNLLTRAFKKGGWGTPLKDKEKRQQIQNDLQAWLKERYSKQLTLV